MLNVALDTELAVVCNGKRSTQTAARWLAYAGERANLTHAGYTQTNVLLDAGSMEPLTLCPGEATEMLEIETNFAPRSETHLVFCAPFGCRLRLFDGESIAVDRRVKLTGAQLHGAHGMYVVTSARIVTRPTIRCNPTALSSAYLDTGDQKWNQPKIPTHGHRQPIQPLTQNSITKTTIGTTGTEMRISQTTQTRIDMAEMYLRDLENGVNFGNMVDGRGAGFNCSRARWIELILKICAEAMPFAPDAVAIVLARLKTISEKEATNGRARLLV